MSRITRRDLLGRSAGQLAILGLAESALLKGDIRSYLERRCIGHCNALSNRFTNMAIRAKLVGMLDPKPATYR